MREIQSNLANRVEKLKQNGLVPRLSVIQVGSRHDSSTYVRMKHKASTQVIVFNRLELTLLI